MVLGAAFMVLVLVLAVVAFQIGCASGAWRAAQFGAMVVSLLVGGWMAMDWTRRNEPPPEDQTASRPVSSLACIKCHESHYTSWHRTFHRTMTREATPDNVKGTFDGAPHQHLGVTSRMVRENDRFFIECDLPAPGSAEPKRLKLSVDRLVGSHWFQQLLHRDEKGRYLRLPMVYHIVEDRWIHTNGRFLAPDNAQFFNKVSVWNESCVYCHNTRPAPNPRHIPGQRDGGYQTTVAELGISCEACHGASERHVRAHQNPARRLAQRYSEEADPTIVNPAKLATIASVDVCASCHSGKAPRYKEWNRTTLADPFLPGRDLKRFWYVPFSEVDYKLLMQNPDSGGCCDAPRPHLPGARDARFWGDGTPLSTSIEYQGMAMSACYEGGHGKMTCLTCHSMHQSEPNHQVKEGMRTNAACYACHESYRDKLVEHTHHPANSQGSLCYNCHMPHQVYGLLGTHRSHRISIPRVRESLGTGKPHACNLCHLDKSLGWTQEHLGTWYATKPEPLSDDDRKIASSLIHLAQSDARSRAVFAGAFSWPPALEASGRDWPLQLMTLVLERERYQVVRYSAHKALRSLHGGAAKGYDYQGTPAVRAAQLRELRSRLESTARPDPSRFPYLPLTAEGRLAEDVLERLLMTRNDPDVTINE